MATKYVKYYLTDGNIIERNGLYVPYHGDYLSGASDISYLDDATLELGPDIKDKLKECNPFVTLSDNRNYKITKDHKTPRFLCIYEPVTSLKKDPTKTRIRLFNEFRDLVGARIMAYENTGKVSRLDDVVVQRFRNDLLEAIYELSPEKRRTIFGNSSIVAKDAKRFYYENKYKFENIYMVEYMNLRSLFIMYLAVTENRRVPSLQDLNQVNDKFDIIKRLDYKSSDEIKKELEEYKKAILNIKDQEELNKRVNDLKTNGEQMTIADFDPSQAHFFDKKK